MSDAVATPTEGASVVVDPTSGASQAPAPAGKPPAAPSEDPAWIHPRIERERAKILKDLGVSSLDDAKKAVDAAKAAEDAKKTAAEKAAELELSLKNTQAEAKAMADALGAYAKSQMGALTEAQRNAVAAVAGDDPAKQLKTIEALQPTWASAAAPAAPAAPPPPKDTAPAPAAPKEGAASSTPPDVKAIHEELQKTNPVLAARFALQNGLFETK